MFSMTLAATSSKAQTALTSWCALFAGRQDQSIEVYAPSKHVVLNPEGAT